MGRTGGLVAAVSLAGVLTAATHPLPLGDAGRGRELLRTKNCVVCHPLAGRGGNAAPDLVNSIVRGYSPYQLAAAMWNHLPDMAGAWQRKNLPWPELSQQGAADLFLYLYSSREFEAPGHVGRGRAVFRSRRCGACHALTSPARQGIRPVASWTSLEDPVALALGMMNHRPQMTRWLEQSGMAYPRLSAQEMTDLLAYLRSEVRQSRRPLGFSLGPPERGQMVLAAKGCLDCHRGSRSLTARPTRHTLADFLVALWNHPLAASSRQASMSVEEMRDLLGYLVAAQFSFERGDAARGGRIYSRKGCNLCHDQPSSGAPPRSGMAGRMNSFAMVEAAWRHGPQMLDRMRARGLNWPGIDSLEMIDLVAYLHGTQLRRRR